MRFQTVRGETRGEKTVFRTSSAIAAAVLMAAVTAARSDAATARTLTFTQTFAEPSFAARGGGDLISVAGTSEFSRPGAPIVPVRRALVLLPPGTTVQSVAAVPSGSRTLSRRVSLAPGQRPLLRGQKTRSTPPDQRIYRSRAKYPSQPCVLESVAECQGYRIASLLLYPVEYLPADRAAVYTPRLDVTISLEPSAAAAFKAGGRATEWVRGHVVNKDLTSQYEKIRTVLSPVEGQYLIVTRPIFLDALKPLIAQRKKSMFVKVLTVEEIVEKYAGDDTADKIRNAIADHYEHHGTRWVLLAGGADDGPPLDEIDNSGWKTGFDRIASSADGSKTAAVSGEGVLYYFDSALPGDGPSWRVEGIGDEIALTTNGAYVAAAAGTELRMFDGGGDELWRVEAPEAWTIGAAGISPSGAYAAAGDSEGVVRICAQSGGVLAGVKECQTGGYVNDLALATWGGKTYVAAVNQFGAYLFRADTGQMVWSAASYAGEPQVVALTDAYMAVGCRGAGTAPGALHVYSLSTGLPVFAWTATLPSEIGSPFDIRMGGRCAVVAAGWNAMSAGTLRVYDLAGGGALKWTKPCGGRLTISNVAVSSTGGVPYASFAATDTVTETLWTGTEISTVTVMRFGGALSTWALGSAPLWTADYSGGSPAVSTSGNGAVVATGRNCLIDVYNASGALLRIEDSMPFREKIGEIGALDTPWEVATRYVGEPYQGSNPEGLIPTDHYYADLTGDWDADGDGIFGELPPLSTTVERDYLPEVYVGRFPAKTVAEMEAMVAKTVAHENAGRDLDPVLVAAATGFQNEAAMVADSVAGMQTVERYENSGAFDDPGALAATLASCDPVVAYLDSHGSPGGPIIPGAYLLKTQAHSPGCLVFADACLTGKFDEPDGCFAESLLGFPGGPAVGCVGASNSIWSAAGIAMNFLGEIYDAGETRQGAAFYNAAADWACADISYHTDAIIMNLFGDPALCLGAEPESADGARIPPGDWCARDPFEWDPGDPMRPRPSPGPDPMSAASRPIYDPWY